MGGAAEVDEGPMYWLTTGRAGSQRSKIAAVTEKGLGEHRWAMRTAPHARGTQVLGKERRDEAGRAALKAIFQA